MKNSEYGSWLGVMTAANVTMPTIAQRRQWRSCAVVMTPAMQQEDEHDRELERQPERDDHQRDEREVLVRGEQRRLGRAADVDEELQRGLEGEERDGRAHREQHDRRERRTAPRSAAPSGSAPG